MLYYDGRLNGIVEASKLGTRKTQQSRMATQTQPEWAMLRELHYRQCTCVFEYAPHVRNAPYCRYKSYFGSLHLNSGFTERRPVPIFRRQSPNAYVYVPVCFKTFFFFFYFARRQPHHGRFQNPFSWLYMRFFFYCFRSSSCDISELNSVH